MAAYSALITTGVKTVRVQKPSLDVVWNTFAILMFVYFVCIYVRVCMYVCICMYIRMYVHIYVCVRMYLFMLVCI